MVTSPGSHPSGCPNGPTQAHGPTQLPICSSCATLDPSLLPFHEPAVGSVAQWVVYSPNGTKRVLAAHRKLDDALDDLVYQEATFDEQLLLDFGVLRCERCSHRQRCFVGASAEALVAPAPATPLILSSPLL
jgi:hypothetical protein